MEHAGEGRAGRTGAGAIPPEACRLGPEVAAARGLRVVRGTDPTGGRVEVVLPLRPADGPLVQAEADLLTELAASGATAFPRVLGRSDRGYVREAASAWSSGRGRRSAEVVSARTGERRALAAAREALDASIAVLHRSGRVLGLTGLEGLGIRGDGSVVVCDLAHVRDDTSSQGRMGDQHWIDGLLGVQGQTLRRRVAVEEPDGEAAPARDPAPSTVGAAARESPLGALAPSPRPPRAWSQEHGVPWSVRLPGEAAAPLRGADGRPQRASRAHLPHDRGRRMPAGPAGTGRRSARRGAGARRVVAAAAAVAAAVVAGMLVAQAASSDAGGADPVAGERPRPAASSPSTARGAPAEATALLSDPRTLVEQLSVARRDHIAGRTADLATVPGSAAAGQDARLADAYAGTDIQGWSTRVTAAEVTGQDPGAGTATVRASISETERTLVAVDGSTSVVPASAEHGVVLELAWTDGAWRIEAVHPQ